MSEKECLFALVDLLAKYSNVYRGSYVPSRVSQIDASPGSKILRESLVDHVGALPIVATFLYPHLGVTFDIGKVLTMLAVHDIGETVVDDVLTVKRRKTDEEISRERVAAKMLLDEKYHPIYDEYEKNESVEAEFAHSVDKIAPNLYELIVDKRVAEERHAHFGFNIADAVEKDRSKMEWNDFLLKFYDELTAEIKSRFAINPDVT